MTLNGVMSIILRYFIEYGSFRDALWLKIYLNFLPQKCSLRHLVFTDVSTMMILYSEPLHLGLNVRGVAKYSDFGPSERYIPETVEDMR